MRILQVNAVTEYGSTGRSVSQLAAALERRGVGASIAYASGPPPTNGYKIGGYLDHKMHALLSRMTGMQAYHSRSATMRLLDYIEGQPPDVVHLRNLHSNYVNLPMLLSYLGRHDIPTVVTLDDCWYYTGRCCHYTVDGCYRWREGCGNCPRLRKDNPSWLFDRSAKMLADKRRLFGGIPRLGVVGVSDWIIREAETSILGQAQEVRRIHNWVDLHTFSPGIRDESRRTLGVQGRYVVLGVASAWSDEKGLRDFLAVGRAIVEGWEVQTVRPTEDSRGQRRPLVLLVGRLPRNTAVPSAVRLVGEIADMRGLAHYYAAADVVLQLSQEETFGNVSAEALASGTPVVAYDSTANPELIGPGCGYVVPPGDIGQVLVGIRRAARDEGHEGIMQRRRFAESHFDMDQRVDDYVATYESLARLSRSTGS